MKKNNYNLKGIKHIYIPRIYTWQYIEKLFKNIIASYTYDEIKLPLLEKSSLFTKTLGEGSDIITKEMFSFKDNKDRSLTLLPEGTSSCLKSLILDGMLRNKSIRNVWYISPMFRKENIQKGRSRLFYQIGLESFCESRSKIDIEHLTIINKLFKFLGINDVILEINYIDNAKHSLYKNLITNFVYKKVQNLSSIDRERLKINPLMILDKIDKALVADMPISIFFLSKSEKKNFLNILYNLKRLYIPFVVNKILVRGLEYYTKLVYEWTSVIENKYLTLCAGGRYDNLSRFFYDEQIYGTGCALGINRVMLKMEKKIFSKIHALLLFEEKISTHLNIKLSDYFRNMLKNINIMNGLTHLSIKQQVKRAKRRNINLFILVTFNSIKENMVIISYKNKYKKKIFLDQINRYICQKKLNL